MRGPGPTEIAKRQQKFIAFLSILREMVSMAQESCLRRVTQADWGRKSRLLLPQDQLEQT